MTYERYRELANIHAPNAPIEAVGSLAYMGRDTDNEEEIIEWFKKCNESYAGWVRAKPPLGAAYRKLEKTRGSRYYKPEHERD